MSLSNSLFLSRYLDNLDDRRSVHGNTVLRTKDPDDQDDTYPGDLIFAVPGDPPAPRNDIQYAEWLTIPTHPEVQDMFPGFDGGNPPDRLGPTLSDNIRSLCLRCIAACTVVMVLELAALIALRAGWLG